MISSLRFEVLFEFPSSCKLPSSSLQERRVLPAPFPPDSGAEALCIEVLASRLRLCKSLEDIIASAEEQP